MTVRRILVATRNPGKLAELRPMLARVGMEAIDLDEAGVAELPEEEDIERFETFEENALAKARYFAERSGGLPVLAEDSGLAVEALGGRPGVRTKRWSGRMDLRGRALDEANNAALLAALDGALDRRARYVCVAAFVRGGEMHAARGETSGRILYSPRGHGGFGYDPLFESTELGVTFAEASAEEKARVSHRGRAVRALLAQFCRAG
ncbi:MAG TPA: RdgB/HAM1 family non-canonical purine NTP pyrophosphatase [Gemmatimonadaceae bacterium]